MSQPPACIFCRILRNELPSTRVYEDERVVAFRDIQPAAPTHVLIIPREHVASLHVLGDDQQEIGFALLRAARIVAEQEGLSEHGYRVLSNVGEWGGQTVDHLHFHVLGGRRLGALG